MTTMTPPATTATAPIDARAATLRQAAADKHDRAVAKTDTAIRELIKTGQDINFRSVARAAGVSVNFLYANDELSRRIARLRASTTPAAAPQPANSSESSNAVIRTLTAQLSAEKTARRSETAELRAQLAAAHGELLHLRRATSATRFET